MTRSCVSCAVAVAIVVLALSTGSAAGSTAGVPPATDSQSGSAPAPPSTMAQAREEITALEPGKPVKFELTAGGKHAYIVELNQGQYTTILLDCPKLSAVARLFDSAGTLIDRTYGNDRNTKEDIELAAEKSDHYKLEIQHKTAQDGGTLCTIQLAESRAASEKEGLLQQARTLIAKAAGMVGGGHGSEVVDQLQKAVALREKLLGPEDPSVAFPLSQLARIYLDKAEYPSAEEFYVRALKIQDKADPGAVEAFVILNNLAEVYQDTDRFDQAERAFLRAMKIAEKLYGPGRPAVINVMVNLANLYDEKGDRVRAQALYEQAIVDCEKALGPDYPGLAVIISNLAGVYSERGDYANAVHLSQRALAIIDKPGRPEDSRLGLALVALGDAYRFQNDLDKAEPLYERSLKVYEKVLGSEDPLVADNLSFLADIYRDHHNFTKAEEFYRRALEIRKKKLGESNSTVGASLDSLGTLYFDQEEYARAEPLFRQALAIREKALGHDHPDVGETLTKLSALDMATGRAPEAELFLARAINISEHNAALNLVIGSERQKLAYLKLSSTQLDRAITLHASLAPDLAAARDMAVTTVLQRKGRVLDLLADNLKTVRQRLNADGVKLLEQLDDVTSHLARLVLSGPEETPISEHEERINALKEQREQLEAEISRRSAQFRAASQPVTLEAVRAALPAKSALIEFVNYQKLLPTDKNSLIESRYIAYVIRPSGQVEWKELGEADKLDREIDAYRQGLRDPNRNDIGRLARNLDEEIFQPLEPLLGDARHLLISPDGQLSLIPFESLVDREHRYAVERYSITYLSTGRDLLRMQLTEPTKGSPVVIADPSFGEPNTVQIASMHGPGPRSRRRSITAAADLSSVYFAPLSGTAQEASSIHSLFPDATVFTGTRASVGTLKQIEAPRILHIATHGFFLEDRRARAVQAPHQSTSSAGGIQDNVDLENPLLRSGLAFAGANLNRTGKDSGILTALEAANLNLWGTKLVTLSACDTGIGEVRDREGVYGLRRSFFLAGTETLVMSLWPVSDYVVREMMTSYYSGLKHGLGRGEALRQAELAMLKRKGHQHPFYWASFIQSGEWANLDDRR